MCSPNGSRPAGDSPLSPADGIVVHMADQECPEFLTYEDATPEQIAEVRARFRERWQAARERHTPEYWAELRQRIGLPARTA